MSPRTTTAVLLIAVAVVARGPLRDLFDKARGGTTVRTVRHAARATR